MSDPIKQVAEAVASIADSFLMLTDLKTPGYFENVSRWQHIRKTMRALAGAPDAPDEGGDDDETVHAASDGQARPPTDSADGNVAPPEKGGDAPRACGTCELGPNWMDCERKDICGPRALSGDYPDWRPRQPAPEPDPALGEQFAGVTADTPRTCGTCDCWEQYAPHHEFGKCARNSMARHRIDRACAEYRPRQPAPEPSPRICCGTCEHRIDGGDWACALYQCDRGNRRALDECIRRGYAHWKARPPERTCGTCCFQSVTSDERCNQDWLLLDAEMACGGHDWQPRQPAPEPECPLAEEMLRQAAEWQQHGWASAACAAHDWTAKVRALQAERDEAIGHAATFEADRDVWFRRRGDEYKRAEVLQAKVTGLQRSYDELAQSKGLLLAEWEALDAKVADLEARLARAVVLHGSSTREQYWQALRHVTQHGFVRYGDQERLQLLASAIESAEPAPVGVEGWILDESPGSWLRWWADEVGLSFSPGSHLGIIARHLDAQPARIAAAALRGSEERDV